MIRSFTECDACGRSVQHMPRLLEKGWLRVTVESYQDHDVGGGGASHTRHACSPACAAQLASELSSRIWPGEPVSRVDDPAPLALSPAPTPRGRKPRR